MTTVCSYLSVEISEPKFLTFVAVFANVETGI